MPKTLLDILAESYQPYSPVVRILDIGPSSASFVDSSQLQPPVVSIIDIGELRGSGSDTD